MTAYISKIKSSNDEKPHSERQFIAVNGLKIVKDGNSLQECDSTRGNFAFSDQTSEN